MLSSVDISATQYRDIRKSKLLFIHILLHSLYYYYFVVLICEFFFGPWMYKCWMNSLNRRLNEIHTCLIHAQLVPLWCAVAIFTLIFLYLKSLCWEGSGEGYLSPSDEVMAVCHKSLGTTDTKKNKLKTTQMKGVVCQFFPFASWPEGTKKNIHPWRLFSPVTPCGLASSQCPYCQGSCTTW